jgi:hypothetical protein
MTLPIVAWFTTRNYVEFPNVLFGRGMYSRQASRYSLIAKGVVNTPAAAKYQKFDLFQISSSGATQDNLLEFETTREAKICLIMGVDDTGMTGGADAVMDLPGWQSVGMVGWDQNVTAPKNHKYSAYQGEPIAQGQMACKNFPAGVHKLGSPDKLGAPYKIWGYHLIVGESDGSVPPLPTPPKGWSGPAITENSLCPDALHEMWVVPGHDENDPEVMAKMWRPWHPSYDYMYGCYYGHEHGSPGSLIGYTEVSFDSAHLPALQVAKRLPWGARQPDRI